MRALRDLDRSGTAANEECRSVLAQLIDAARGQSLEEGMLRSAREYLRVEWNRPRPARQQIPATSGRPVPSPPSRNRGRGGPDYSWSRFSRERGGPVCARRDATGAARSRLLDLPSITPPPSWNSSLAGIRKASSPRRGRVHGEPGESGDRAIGRAYSLEARPPSATLDPEVANARRVASEWSKARVPLSSKPGSIWRQVRAILSSEPGRGRSPLPSSPIKVAASKPWAALEECVEMYEEPKCLGARCPEHGEDGTYARGDRSGPRPNNSRSKRRSP